MLGMLISEAGDESFRRDIVLIGRDAFTLLDFK